MGAGEVVRYVTNNGTDRVAGIVLSAPTLPALLRTDDNPGGVDKGVFEEGWRVMRVDIGRWMANFTSGDFNVYFGTARPMSEDLGAWTRRQIVDTPLTVALACQRSMVEGDFRAELRRLDLPTLIIHGDVDTSAPLELTARPTAALVPGSRHLQHRTAPVHRYVPDGTNRYAPRAAGGAAMSGDILDLIPFAKTPGAVGHQRWPTEISCPALREPPSSRRRTSSAPSPAVTSVLSPRRSISAPRCWSSRPTYGTTGGSWLLGSIRRNSSWASVVGHRTRRNLRVVLRSRGRTLDTQGDPGRLVRVRPPARPAVRESHTRPA
jgi:hypothetical protein